MASKRVNAVGLLRAYGREQVVKGTAINRVYSDLQLTLNQVIQTFLTEHELPGCRYWLHHESDSYFVTVPGETLDDSYDASLCIELTRYEFLGRQDLHFAYLENDL